MKGLLFLAIVMMFMSAISCRQEKREGIEQHVSHDTIREEPSAGRVIYTCPMHPQIKSDQPGDCPVCGMHLEAETLRKSKTSKAEVILSRRQQFLANIHTDTVRMMSLKSQVILTATTIFNPANVQIISAHAGGRIEKLYVRNPGERIYIGQKLYDLYSPELLSAEEEYLLAVKQEGLFKEAAVDFSATIRAMKQKLIRYGMTETQLQSLLKKDVPDGSVTIYSGKDGYVVDKIKDEGDYVNEGEAVFQIASGNTIWVKAQVYDKEMQVLSRHPEVWVETDALPGKRLPGRIVFEYPILNPGSGTGSLSIAVDNPGHRLQPGMQAYVYLQSGGEKAGNIVAPKSSVIFEEDHDYIWIQRPDSVFERREIKTGRDNHRYVEITGGVQPGEAVVSSGAYLLNSEYILRHGKNNMTGMNMP